MYEKSKEKEHKYMNCKYREHTYKETEKGKSINQV